MLASTSRCPPEVYSFLYYLEARAMQRARAQQTERCTKEFTFHQWRRVLYSRVRARVFNFYNYVETSMKGAEIQTPDNRSVWGLEYAKNEITDASLKGLAVAPVAVTEPTKERGGKRARRT